MPRWAPRIPKERIRRLYESDARELLDEDLLDDVGSAIAMRCRSILTVSEARRGRLACPECAPQGREVVTARFGNSFACPECSWHTTWDSFQRSFRRRQLHEGAAGPAFRRFLDEWGKARTAGARMLAVDGVIHAFHSYLMRDLSTGEERMKPTRPACCNLIQGKMGDIVPFLEKLAGHDTHGEWRKAVGEMRGTWSDWRIARPPRKNRP